jgi:hypothetical protein
MQGAVLRFGFEDFARQILYVRAASCNDSAPINAQNASTEHGDFQAANPSPGGAGRV